MILDYSDIWCSLIVVRHLAFADVLRLRLTSKTTACIVRQLTFLQVTILKEKSIVDSNTEHEILPPEKGVKPQTVEEGPPLEKGVKPQTVEEGPDPGTTA